MSLPKEWNLQASQVCLDKPVRPQSLISDDIEIQPKYENKFLHVVYHPSIPDHCRAPLNAALLAECDNSGSLFSIQSAPVVATVSGGVGGPEPGATSIPDPIGMETILDRQRDSYPGAAGVDTIINSFHSATDARDERKDTLLRPSSLAFDTYYHASKPNNVDTQLSAELDEDDNENLLTVSSLTARPLIAKSREINKSKKEKLQLRRRKKVCIATSSDDDDEGPPDGGYGWIIVFGAFSVQFWVAGLVKSYGVLYVEIMENFPNSSATTASWIPAILSALCLALAPVSSALCQRFSCRIVVIIGGIFCGLGLTLSYFATSLIHLLFTFGILTGIGGGLSTTPGIVIVSQYFEKRRALANGITISGTAAGSFIFPTLIERLIHSFGFHGTILILGGCMLHVCVSGALYRPLEDTTHKKTVQSRESAPFASRMDFKENLGHLSSSEDHLSRRCLEDLFLDEALRDKNRNSLNLDNKFVNVTEKTLQESEDELKDIISNAIFLKPMASIRSCSILHSVEDLSTDSTCVYKKRASGFDSQRNSKRYKQRTEDVYSKIQQQQQQLQDTVPPRTEPQPLQKPPLPLQPQPQGMKTLESNGDLSSKTQLDNTPAVINNNSSNNSCSLSQNNNRGLSKSMIIPTPVGDLSNIFDDDYEEYRDGLLDKISQYLDISLLQDITFILMCLSVGLMSVGCPYMLYYLPAYVISAGYTKSEAGYLVAVSAALDLIGRLTLGWLSDLDLFDRKKTYIVAILGAGAAVLTIPTTDRWIVIVCSAGCYGLCLGSWYLLVPVLLTDLFGTDRISSSYGLVRMFQSIGAISVPPLAGLLRDLSGGYEICFYCMGVCMVLGSIPLLVVIVKDTLALSEKKLTLDRVA
ncbi:uncharacterized protein LOC129764973 [Toxorhynchites rutilus septentrionalis]|uniref:uncharacterized protein LOC129764973 n=1 Tax=Toxorhynchites rutilus septentrionalis TaxID=329112 RepID=UPI00247A8319|nr:uncharacterized protein LOC129764973 [Toxorhynchites rutilus septentrionalis]